MSIHNPYKTLGVKNFADKQTIKSAYRRLALKYHPDKNPNNQQAHIYFNQVKEAYDILSSPSQKSIVDDKLKYSSAPMPRYGQGPYAFNRQKWDNAHHTKNSTPEDFSSTKKPFLESTIWIYVIKPILFILLASILMLLIIKLS